MKSLARIASVVGLVVWGASLHAAEDQSAGMHDHMMQMRAQMAAMHAEQDPQKRAVLMEQHHQQMRTAMRMLEPGDTQNMSTEQRVRAMEERMGMMTMMMEQMMVHQHADTAEPAQEAPAAEHEH